MPVSPYRARIFEKLGIPNNAALVLNVKMRHTTISIFEVYFY